MSGSPSGDRDLPGVIPSPNIWNWPQVYEWENQGVDPGGVIEAAMREVMDWSGQHLLDIGCGTGFHLPRFAEDAAQVTGIEPHPPTLCGARARVARLDPHVAGRIRVIAGSAEAIPLPSRTVDVAHARWAYFFGPGCEPGLAELERVMHPGGVAFVIDNDATRSTFGGWFRQALPSFDPAAVERFWRRHGFEVRHLDMGWALPDRSRFEQVVRIEFEPSLADRILSEHAGSTVDYAVNLWWRRY